MVVEINIIDLKSKGYMVIEAKEAQTETQTETKMQRRKSVRYDHKVSCDLKSVHKTLRATTLNISEGGMCIKLQSFGSVDEGAIIAIQMENYPLINGRVVWVNNRIVGVAFIDTVRDHPEIADLLERLKGR